MVAPAGLAQPEVLRVQVVRPDQASVLVLAEALAPDSAADPAVHPAVAHHAREQAAEAVVPAVERLELSVRAVASPRPASQSGRREPNSNYAKPHRLVASAFLVVTARPLSRCAGVHRSPTSLRRLARVPRTS